MHSIDDNRERYTDNVVHETVQRQNAAINDQGNQDKTNQNHMLFNHITDSRVNVHYVDLNGDDIKDDNVIDHQIKYDDYLPDYQYSIPDGYLIGDGLNKRKQDFDIVKYRTIGGGVEYNDSSNIPHSNLNLTYEMSNRLYNAIKADPKSKTLLFDWDNINSYNDFVNYIDSSNANDYYLTLCFPAELKKRDYDSYYTDLANRKSENLCVVGWNGYWSSKLNQRFTNEQFRINISKHDPELAKYIYDTVMGTVDKNIVNGSVDIGHDKLENADGILHITLNADSPSEYTYTDLTGLAKVDKTRANTIDIPIIKPDNAAEGQLTAATRTIKFNFPGGNVPLVYRKICNDNGVVMQTVHFWKDPIVDSITGRTVKGYFGDWTPVVRYDYNHVGESTAIEPFISYDHNDWVRDTSKYAGQFPPVTFPHIPGFTLHINKAKA